MLGLKRIIKAGFVNFWRNGFVSFSCIVVMTITLFVMGSLIFLNALLTTSLELLKDKVDVNVYFVTTTPEEKILALKSTLESKPEVERVEYISREDALIRFLERHKNDETELQAIRELPDNPLRASLAIKAKDPSYYEALNTFFASEESVLGENEEKFVAKVNYNDNRAAIESLTRIIDGIERFGLVITAFLCAASIIIIFNTIRMVIYIAREEISVMRLVGASDLYIRGPFVFEGIMYGFAAGIVTLVLFYPITFWLGPKTMVFFGNFNLFTYYTSHFGPIFLTIIGTGILLGAVSSFFAVKKYLRV